MIHIYNNTEFELEFRNSSHRPHFRRPQPFIIICNIDVQDFIDIYTLNNIPVHSNSKK